MDQNKNMTSWNSQAENSGFLENVVEVSEEIAAKNLVTVIAIVVSAVIIIALLFIVAIFIDCRQQKHEKTKLMQRLASRKIFKLPKFDKKNIQDKEHFVDKMVIEDETNPPATSLAYS